MFNDYFKRLVSHSEANNWSTSGRIFETQIFVLEINRDKPHFCKSREIHETLKRQRSTFWIFIPESELNFIEVQIVL